MHRVVLCITAEYWNSDEWGYPNLQAAQFVGTIPLRLVPLLVSSGWHKYS